MEGPLRKYPHAESVYEFARAHMKIVRLGVRVPSVCYFKAYQEFCLEESSDVVPVNTFWKVIQDYFGGRVDKKFMWDFKDRKRRMVVTNLGLK